ncbi:MAG TPA: hypothetical protein VFB63_26030, partial [Bryobacteraceae bacterium]|nr:hypothetical protein [Bryobacteraceae bacterium]
MPRTRPGYPPEFRQQIVELVQAGRSPMELLESSVADDSCGDPLFRVAGSDTLDLLKVTVCLVGVQGPHSISMRRPPRRVVMA